MKVIKKGGMMFVYVFFDVVDVFEVVVVVVEVV